MDGSVLPAIIIVDDEPAICTVVTRMIQRCYPGQQVYTCQTSGEALAYANQAAIACVITDYALDQDTGVNVAQRLHQQWPGLPIILITGLMPADTPLVADQFVAILTKPIMLHTLCAAVKQYL